jgi:hypothetical protein
MSLALENLANKAMAPAGYIQNSVSNDDITRIFTSPEVVHRKMGRGRNHSNTSRCSFETQSLQNYNYTKSGASLDSTDFSLDNMVDNFIQDVHRKSLVKENKELLKNSNFPPARASKRLQALNLECNDVNLDKLSMTVCCDKRIKYAPKKKNKSATHINIKFLEPSWKKSSETITKKLSKTQIKYKIPDLDNWFENQWEDICERNHINPQQSQDHLTQKSKIKKNENNKSKNVYPSYLALAFIGELNSVSK